MKAEAHISSDAQAVAVQAVCPACGAGELDSFFKLSDLPVNCIALCTTREAALKCPKGDIDLGFCRRCGAVSNLVFDAARLIYDPSYDNSLHFSPSFQKYAELVARNLVDEYGLHSKNIIEVGCGSGEFLSLLCDLGNNRGVGFDPAFIADRADLNAGQGITIVRDYYSERHAEFTADFVICRHVLEHIAKPQQFLRRMRAALAGKPDVAIFFELPNASFVFQNGGIWDIIYEHCLYYSSDALARLFSACGFDVQKVSSTFHGQYLCLEARVSSREAGLLGGAAGELHLRWDDIRKFAEEYCASRTYWQDTLSRFVEKGKRIALWGAGAKGAMFLNAFGNVPSLEYIADVNPHKCGLYIPGTGQRVVSPEFLKEYRPDVLLIANPNYRDEITRQLSTLGISPDLLSL